MRNNEVRTVMLHGVPIVALIMDNLERLCLAQISNTLLKNFSYNEIHNRRVALGITCVQCTPVQLELLRRAGAMPVSSRRCGMITKREAERLCKSFLAETTPPKLPDSFSFDVYHHCAWGCRGAFNPSRYNSSRAKCIKCCYCGLFFSPNKFIFHSHRLPESKYVQPDAANFNSWRRHIKLSGSPADEIMFAWEDVKAMFNGGSRKRAMAASLTSVSKQQQQRRQQQQQEQQQKQQQQQNHSSPQVSSSESLAYSPPPPSKKARHSMDSPETSGISSNAYLSMDPKTSPPSSSTPGLSVAGGSNQFAQSYPFSFLPLPSNKTYGSLVQGLGGNHMGNLNPFLPQGSLAAGMCLPPLSPHSSGISPTHLSLLKTGSGPHPHSSPMLSGPDVRQTFAEFMGTSPLLPYNYLQLSRYWHRPPIVPPHPNATPLPPVIAAHSATSAVTASSPFDRHRLQGGGISLPESSLPSASTTLEGLVSSSSSLMGKGLGGEQRTGVRRIEHSWDREENSLRSSLSHRRVSSAFRPVDSSSSSTDAFGLEVGNGRNNTSCQDSSGKNCSRGTSFRTEDLICDSSSDSVKSEGIGEENDVDVIGGESEEKGFNEKSEQQQFLIKNIKKKDTSTFASHDERKAFSQTESSSASASPNSGSKDSSPLSGHDSHEKKSPNPETVTESSGEKSSINKHTLVNMVESHMNLPPLPPASTSPSSHLSHSTLESRNASSPHREDIRRLMTGSHVYNNPFQKSPLPTTPAPSTDASISRDEIAKFILTYPYFFPSDGRHISTSTN